MHVFGHAARTTPCGQTFLLLWEEGYRKCSSTWSQEKQQKSSERETRHAGQCSTTLSVPSWM